MDGLILRVSDNCVNCSNPGIVEAMHIYSSTNVFERSITILEAVCEMFPTVYLLSVKSMMENSGKDTRNISLKMCPRCAETTSVMYQSYMALLAMSDSAGFLANTVLQIEQWHTQRNFTVPIIETALEFKLSDDDATITLKVVDAAETEKNIDQVVTSVSLGLGDGRHLQQVLKPDIILTESTIGNVTHIDQSDEDANSARIETNPGSKGHEVLQSHHEGHEPLNDQNVVAKLRIPTSKKKPGSCNVANRRYFKCNQCESQFIPIFELHDHILSVHEGKRKVQCENCPFEFHPEIFKYETHVCITEENWKLVGKCRYVCDICGQRFGGERLLTYHKDKIHTQENIRSKCHFCHKQIVDRQKLFLHMEIHQNTRNYLCSQCGRGFSQKRGLQKHIQVHTMDVVTRRELRYKEQRGEFSCEHCNRKCSYKRNLQDHILRKHTPQLITKHLCPICGKPCFSTKKLSQHISTHQPKTNDKPGSRPKADLAQNCGFCFKKFASSMELRRHFKLKHCYHLRQRSNSNLPNDITKLSPKIDQRNYTSSKFLPKKNSTVNNFGTLSGAEMPDLLQSQFCETRILNSTYGAHLWKFHRDDILGIAQEDNNLGSHNSSLGIMQQAELLDIETKEESQFDDDETTRLFEVSEGKRLMIKLEQLSHVDGNMAQF